MKSVRTAFLLLLFFVPAATVVAKCETVVIEGYLHLDQWNGARTHGFVHCRDRYGSPALGVLDVAHYFYVSPGWGVGGLIWSESMSSYETTTASTGPTIWVGCPRDCYTAEFYGYDTQAHVGGEGFGSACADWNLQTSPAQPPQARSGVHRPLRILASARREFSPTEATTTRGRSQSGRPTPASGEETAGSRFRLTSLEP